jgi:hypothetical protein
MTGGGPSASAPSVKGLNCPNCGAAIELRSGELAQTVACSSCAAVLDPKDPNLKVLQEFKGAMKWQPIIPLGTRGKLKGDPYEVIGFQVRGIRVDDVDYFWSEYLLWNPYKGFRYLSEYDGHWNDIVVVKTTPEEKAHGRQPIVQYMGTTFRHFQSAVASTKFVIGEFPWEVRLGDKARTRDFVAPPHMLSEEATADETTWSLGTYTSPAYIWEVFKLQGKPHAPRGVYANQPDPSAGSFGRMMKLFGIFAAAIVALFLFRALTAQRSEVFRQSYTVLSRNPDSTAFVTPLFTLGGRTSNVQVTIDTDLANNWAFFNLALINEQTGTAYDFGRQVSYYSGNDSDGRWSEGSTTDRSYVATVPPGRYYLRVQPELGNDNPRPMSFRLVVKRDVPRFMFYAIALGLLAIPPLFAGIRKHNFEQARWAESDYAPETSDDDDE